MQDKYLRELDIELFAHLKSLQIEPQIYAMRWLRLLFLREIPFEFVTDLWIVLFADFDLCLWMCVSILVFLRSKILSSEDSEALQYLLRVSDQIKTKQTLHSLISMATALREKFDTITLESKVVKAAVTAPRQAPKSYLPWERTISQPRQRPSTPLTIDDIKKEDSSYARRLKELTELIQDCQVKNELQTIADRLETRWSNVRTEQVLNQPKEVMKSDGKIYSKVSSTPTRPANASSSWALFGPSKPTEIAMKTLDAL